MWKIFSGKERSRVAAEKNNFYKRYPTLVEEWDYDLNNGIDITSIACGTNTKFYWKCLNGHRSYASTISHRLEGNGCPICGRTRTNTASCKPVINLDTGEIFDSLKDAGLSCGGSLKTISNVCGKPGKKAYGYHWDYLNGAKRNEHKVQKVINITTGEVFQSIQAAATHYKCNRSSISSVCRGKTKTSCGCQWKYFDEQS